MGKKKSKSSSSSSATTISSKKEQDKEEEDPIIWRPTSYEYKVDYNDHFETPLVAYQDILPLLDAVLLLSVPQHQSRNSNKTTVNRDNHVIYDPYYCNGRTSRLLHQLGFSNVIHEKRDFYKDIQQQTLPDHYNTLITNPPYSDTHKERCLEFCIQQFREYQRPFFLLMPNYVATKNYYKKQLEAISLDDMAYVVPYEPYEYDHPEGTGHSVPPFASLWFCGIGRDNVAKLKTIFENHHHHNNNNEKSQQQPKFVTSLEGLEEAGVISMERRPNPRQRKKRRQQQHQQQQQQVVASLPNKKTPSLKQQQQPPKSGHNITKKKKKKQKSSRYRDATGARTKTRF